MSKNDSRTSRRKFMRVAGSGLAVLPLVHFIPVRTAAGAEMPPVTADDATAKALAYVDVSTTSGQQCDNCNFWQGGSAERGGCQLFPGKSVAAKGWCKSWIKKS